MAGARLFTAVALAVAAGATAAACGSGSSGAAHPSTSPTPTVTTTVTAPPPGPSSTTPAPSPTPTRPGSPTEHDAATVVSAYFDAINAHDYRAAWNLGGKNLGSSYAAFVQGFAGTADDTVRITGTTGSTVALTLTAVQTDGSVKTYAGTYTVSGGVIVSADVRQTGGSGPATPTGPIPPGGFRNCTEARAHGYHDIPRTSPAYAPHLDRDNDGVACETHE